MTFLQLDDLPKETVTPKHSTAFGELVTGDKVEVGRLRFKKGEGAEEHSHDQEQILIVLEGKVKVTLDGEAAELGPGSGYHARSGVPHAMEVLEDSMVLSCKDVVDGAGHRI